MCDIKYETLPESEILNGAPVWCTDSSNVTRNGPGFISTIESPRSGASKLPLSSPHGPRLMPVNEERGLGQLQRACDEADGSIETKSNLTRCLMVTSPALLFCMLWRNSRWRRKKRCCC